MAVARTGSASSGRLSAGATQAVCAFSVVVPVHNEAKILRQSLTRLLEVLRGLGRDFDVVVCENGSTDETAEVAEALRQDHPELRVERLPQANYGLALRHAIACCKHELVLLVNADFWDVGFIREALVRLEEGAELVVGSKAMRGSRDERPLIRRVITCAFNQMLRWTLGFRGTDTHGVKAFRRAPFLPLVAACVTDHWIFDTELVLRAERAGLRTLELPVSVRELRAPSCWALLRRSPGVIGNLLKLWRALPGGITVGSVAVKVLRWLLFAYVALIPLGWSPLPLHMQWADLVFAALLVWACVARIETGLRLRWLDMLVLFYVAASAVSVARSQDLARSAAEFAKEGSLALVYLGVAVVAREAGMRRAILRWTAASAAVVGGVTLLAWVVHLVAGRSPFLVGGPCPLLDRVVLPGLGPVVRVQGPFVASGLFASYMTCALPILVALAVGFEPIWTRRWAGIGSVLAGLATLLTLTYSVVGCAAATLLVAWRRLGQAGWRRKLRTGLAAITVLVFLALNLVLTVTIRGVGGGASDRPVDWPAPYYYAFEARGGVARVLDVPVWYQPMSYGLLKAVAWDAFRLAPLTGVGLGTFHKETERAVRAGQLQETYQEADPHSEWLGRLAETGLLGGVTLLILWIALLQMGWVLARRGGEDGWVTGMVVAGCLGLLVNSVNVDIMHFRFLWVGLGLLRAELECVA